MAKQPLDLLLISRFFDPIHANVRLHAKVPLVALLGLMHLGDALALVVLGRAGRRDQCRIHHSTGLEHQATVNQFGVDGRQYLLAQSVLFEQVAKPQDCALIEQPGVRHFASDFGDFRCDCAEKSSA